MAQENLTSDERLELIEKTLEKQERILERMESRERLRSVFFWVKIAGAGALLVVSVIGALLYARVLNEVSTQIENIGR